MLRSSPSLLWKLSVSALLLLLSSPISAAPTRTRCRCVVLDADSPSPQPPSSQTSLPQADICTNLGPQLEHFRFADPELYRAVMDAHSEPASITPTEHDLRPLPTDVLSKLAERDAMYGEAVGGAPAQRIVCQSVPEGVEGAYSASQSTLLLLQIIVAVAILGCVAEGISALTNWFEPKVAVASAAPEPSVQLSGDEKRLYALSASDRFLGNGEKALALDVECDYDDDEMDRPVM
ncbi:hypothetical protein EJ04DRAFT_50770 [Polyplosphaeria fusca]|uniref:Uncharacterized protein n=1 Tax=Polyplosphaeria fusca TaxID=682080 RepID=A0A9P4V6I7_9PLEO|nr:hypothetical protein EJ04DRAFT_50770 [Polyplosphaeria fusca]